MIAPKISIVIPVFNEVDTIVPFIVALLEQSQEAKQNNVGIELIVVDGKSVDGASQKLASLQQEIILLDSEPSRAKQMNTGAKAANGEVLLFLHADTQLPNQFWRDISRVMGQYLWGRFDVRLSSGKPWAKVVSFFINHRSKLTAIATGDQAIFVKREVFFQNHSFPDIPLMEDVALCKTLKNNAGEPACLSNRVITSSRRWEKNGVIKTILLMWQLRFYYFIGVSPQKLHKKYYG